MRVTRPQELIIMRHTCLLFGEADLGLSVGTIPSCDAGSRGHRAMMGVDLCGLFAEMFWLEKACTLGGSPETGPRLRRAFSDEPVHGSASSLSHGQI